ncbi:MAG: hypothetical protein JXA54_05315 [Candidatus Heimdallarchaeota archaeon]|nr:hypothetical protein [Candidatus Heimdallarchaeota archaeon]
MKLKLIKVSNQWSIYQQFEGGYKKVGKIFPKPTNTTFFSLNNIKAQITNKRYDNQEVLTLSAENILLKCYISTQKTLTSIIWKDNDSKTAILKATINNNQIKVISNNSKLAKHYQISDSHLIEITKPEIYSPIVVLASLSPFFL